MAFLTTAELGKIRDHFGATLPHTCKIEYVSTTKTSIGSSAKSWTSRGTAIACRLALSRGAFGMLADQVREGQFWDLYLLYDQTVEVADRVTINEVVYQVKQTNTDESENFLKHVLLEV